MNKYKRTPLLFFFLLPIFLFIACDKGFSELNQDPNALTEIPPASIFSSILLHTSGRPQMHGGSHLNYTAMAVQHLAALTANWPGDKYIHDEGRATALFMDTYQFDVKLLSQLFFLTEGQEKYTNLRAMARIWRVLVFQRLTDLYGDVPYFDAGKAYTEGILQPAYDPQSEIYNDFFKEIDIAIDAFDDSLETVGTADFIYSGDLKKWKKLGNSLRLRLAFRLLKVNPLKAKGQIIKAIEGGVMTDNEDSAFIRHQYGGNELNGNGIHQFFVNENNQRLSKTFVDWLIAENDPRLYILGAIDTLYVHRGLPNGYTTNSIVQFSGESPYNPNSYSRLNPYLTLRDAPLFFQSYAEVAFLQSEAILRGIVTGDKKMQYQAGIEGALKQFSQYYDWLSLSDSLILDYKNTHQLSDQYTEALNQINTQYWAATFLNDFESFANWRRSGYPELTPVPENLNNDTGGIIPRRLRYPIAERSLNGDNLQIAIDRQGTNDMATRVWWDVE